MKTEATPEVYKPTPEETEAWEKSKAEVKPLKGVSEEDMRLLREKIANSDWKPVNLRAALSWSDEE